MKNCVLWVGNGFTMSLVNHVRDHTREIELVRLFPPPDWTTKFSSWDGPQSIDSLADMFKGTGDNAGLYDILESEIISEYNPKQFLDICVALNQQSKNLFDINQKNLPIKITYDSAELWIQLRHYIWHLIRNYDRELESVASNGFATWPWMHIIKKLITKYMLTAVSYNYDVQLEKCLGDFGVTTSTRPSNSLRKYNNRNQRSVPFLKPHGSSSYSQGVGCNDGARIVSLGSVQGEVSVSDHLDSCPVIPHIVPPGAPRDIYFDELSTTNKAVAASMLDCDVFIICGFSALGPDEIEFRGYVGNLNRQCIVLQVGLPGDEGNNAARALRGRVGNSNYHFFDSDRLWQLFDFIDGDALK